MKRIAPGWAWASAALCAGLMAARTGHAGVIGDLNYTTTIQAFGEQATPYFGQTFVAPAGHLQTLSFVLNTGTGVTRFRTLITETAPGGTVARGVAVGVHPTNVVFASDPMVLPADPAYATFTTETVDLGGLLLQPGHVYAFVLDAYTDYDGDPNQAGVGTQNSDTYPGGNFFYFNSGAPAGTRTDQFADAANWFNWGDIDMSFQITFSPVTPEPSSLSALRNGALLALGCRLIRRRRP